MRLIPLALSLGCLILSSTCRAQQSQHHLYTFNGDSAGDLFGWSVAGAGDVNRDGYADLIVGAYLTVPSKSSGGSQPPVCRDGVEAGEEPIRV